MAKLPQLTANELIKILAKIDFTPVRQAGSHVFLRNSEGITTVIPNQPGEKLDRGLLLKIIKKDLSLTRKEFEKLL